MRLPVRVSLAAAGLAALGLALPASAAIGPRTLVLTDKSGDLAAPGLKGDITNLTYSTHGKTVLKKVGSKLTKVYTPDTLVVTLKTADDIDSSGTTTYEIDSVVPGCGSGLDAYFTPGVGGSEGGGCINTDASDPTKFTNEGLDGAPTLAGKTMTFTFHFKGFSGKQVKAGTVISGVHAFTALVEPVSGVLGPYLLTSALANDNLTSDRTYKIG